MKNILVVAGSSDSLKLIEKMQLSGYKITVVNMSRQIFDSLMKIKGIRIISGATTLDDFSKIIKQGKISLIIDESHPLATSVSPVLMETSLKYGIAYCRYEGKSMEGMSENVIIVKDNEECVKCLNKTEGKILLTIGSTNLDSYVKVNNYEKRLFVKILPTIATLEKCEKLGIPSSNIFAMQGKVSRTFLSALISHIGASVIVSKDISLEGGVERKIEAAEENGIPIIIINKPEVLYINKYGTVNEVLEFALKA